MHPDVLIECASQINATSMAPITAVQFGANRLYEDIAKKLKGGLMMSIVWCTVQGRSLFTAATGCDQLAATACNLHAQGASWGSLTAWQWQRRQAPPQRWSAPPRS